jgi:ATPase subunit of ABC transporter with duplicated ATPase domains
VLLLDEPTNDLDTETLASLENAIAEVPGCVVVTAHDRWFLDRVATHTSPGKARKPFPPSGIGSEEISQATNRTRSPGSGPKLPARTG